MTTEKKKYKNINITTPEGTFKFPKLNTPDTKYNAAGVYGVKLVLSEEAAAPIVEKLKAAAQTEFEATKAMLEARVEEEKGEKKAKAKKELEKLAMADLPIKDCVDEDGNPNGDVELNFNMKASRVDTKTQKTIIQTPKLFDAAGKLIVDIPQVWGGTVGCVAGQIVPFYTALVGAGAALRLSAVQIVKLVNGAGGTAESFGFGAKEGFAAPEKEAEETFKEATDTDDDF